MKYTIQRFLGGNPFDGLWKPPYPLSAQRSLSTVPVTRGITRMPSHGTSLFSLRKALIPPACGGSQVAALNTEQNELMWTCTLTAMRSQKSHHP